MKILMLAPLPPPSGGIASWTLRYIDYCKRNNISLKVVNIAIHGKRASDESAKRSIKDEVVRTHYIISELTKEIKRYKPDVLHLNTACQPLGVIRDALCARLIPYNVPIILHCRCNIEDQLGKKSASIKAFKYLVRRSAKVIVLNRFSKKFIDDIDDKKALFIPDFIDKVPSINDYIIRPEIHEIGYVGHIEKAKGIPLILESAKKTPAIHYTLVGAVHDNISRDQIPANVTFTGRVTLDKVKGYLSDMDVFLFPSRSEGFSNALLEAMSMGVPVIASDVGANMEMLENKGGIVIQDISAGKIVKAIKQMSSDELRRHMSEWNYNKVKNSYTEEIVMNKYIDLYKSII